MFSGTRFSLNIFRNSSRRRNEILYFSLFGQNGGNKTAYEERDKWTRRPRQFRVPDSTSEQKEINQHGDRASSEFQNRKRWMNIFECILRQLEPVFKRNRGTTSKRIVRSLTPSLETRSSCSCLRALACSRLSPTSVRSGTSWRIRTWYVSWCYTGNRNNIIQFRTSSFDSTNNTNEEETQKVNVKGQFCNYDSKDTTVDHKDMNYHWKNSTVALIKSRRMLILQ